MVATQWLQSFQEALNARNALHISNHLFADDCYWRDMVAFSWNIITLQGRDAIREFVTSSSSSACLEETCDWKLDPSRELRMVQQDADFQCDRLLEFWATFATAAGTGRAHVRLNVADEPHPAAHTVLTVLSKLHSSGDAHHPARPIASPHGPVPHRRYWHEEPKNDDDKHEDPYVLLIGGGQAGLSLAARLQHLNVPYLVCESGAAPGSSWRGRYPSLCLHDPVYYNHLPYLPFPSTAFWPLYSPRDKLATWLELYATALDLKVQSRTRVETAVRRSNDDEWWTVQLRTKHSASDDDDDSKTATTTTSKTIRARHIVFCTGNSSHPRVPSFSGQENFRGLQIHSSQYRGGNAYRTQQHQKLRHAIVIGSNNSAFDIVQDLWEQLMAPTSTNKNDDVEDVQLESITMIQRTPSMVVSPDSVVRLGLGPLYSEEADYQEADLVATTVPYHLALRSRWKQVAARMQENDAALLDGLRRAGFQLDDDDNEGIFAKSASQGGGFYIDVGCAALLARGDVAVRHATVERLEADAVVVRDVDTGHQERLPADLIVYATGFHTMERWVSEICGKDIAERVGRTWGLGMGTSKDPGPWEGELRNMWKPTTVDGLWFQGGNLAQNRHYSRYLALQLAARYRGLETNVYGVPEATPFPED